MQHGIFYFIIISLLNIKEHYGLYTVQPPNECNLSDSVIKEIRNYQPVVNRIITEITNGKFKHGTWDRYCDLNLRYTWSWLINAKNLFSSSV